MNKRTETVVIMFALLGAAYFALRLPFMVYGGAPEFHDDILAPRFTPTPLSAERAMTQQAFAMMFFTPTSTAAPAQPFFAFLIPNTGRTQTFTPAATITNTVTPSPTPTRTLLPVFQTQTRVQDGGVGAGGGNLFTSTPIRTPTSAVTASPTRAPNLTLTVFTSPTSTSTLAASPRPSLTNTSTDIPTETDTPKPANTHKPPTDTPVPPTATDAPPPTATDAPPPTATDAPPPTATPQAFPGSGSIILASTPSVNMTPFMLLYLLGATFLGVVFRKQ